MPKISVIIPCYNLSDYLDGCLESINQQEVTEQVEYIFIDDGSTDGTTRKLEDFCSSHSNTELIIQDNQGVSKARNNGLRKARGEYIYLLDGDDILTSNAISIMLDSITDSPDIVIAPLKRLKNGHLYDSPFLLKEGVYDLSDFTNRFSFFPMAPQPLYRRDIISQLNIRFNPTIAVGEVLEFTFKFIVNAKNIKVVNQPLFIYVLRSSGSATQNHSFTRDLSVLNSIQAYKEILGPLYNLKFFQISIFKLLFAFTYNKYARLKLKGEDVRNTIVTIKNNPNVGELMRSIMFGNKISLRDRVLAYYFKMTGYRGYKLLVSLLSLR